MLDISSFELLKMHVHVYVASACSEVKHMEIKIKFYIQRHKV